MIAGPLRSWFCRQIKSSIRYQGQLYVVSLEDKSRLSSSLKVNNVPLQFQCAQIAECGTCCIGLDKDVFQKLREEQPISSAEAALLTNFGQNCRLSCQLRTSPTLEQAVILLDI